MNSELDQIFNAIYIIGSEVTVISKIILKKCNHSERRYLNKCVSFDINVLKLSSCCNTNAKWVFKKQISNILSNNQLSRC